MPQTVTPSLQTRLEAGATSLCNLLEITRVDGTIFRYTTATRDKVFDALTYKAGGFSPTDIQLTFDSGGGDLAMTIAFNDEITQPDVRTGKFEGAIIKILWGDWQFPQYGTLPRFSGVITGSQVTNQNAAQFSCSGEIYLAQKPLGEMRSPSCRAQFGDIRCKFDIIGAKIVANVTAVDENYITVDVTDIAAVDPQDVGSQLAWRVYMTNSVGTIEIDKLEMHAAIGGGSYEFADGTVFSNHGNDISIMGDPWIDEPDDYSSPWYLGILLSIAGPVQEFVIRATNKNTAPTSVRLQYSTAIDGSWTDAVGFTFTDLVWSNGETKTFKRTAVDIQASYQNGILKFVSGENTGLSYDIIEVVQNVGDTTIQLALHPSQVVAIGDDVEIYPGCDKTLQRCKYYANVVNFRGEPYVPTTTYQGQNQLIT